MTPRTFALAGLLAVLPLTSAAPPHTGPTPAAIEIGGLVTDASTGAPLRDVQVWVAGTPWGALTRADGRYSVALSDAWSAREVTVRFERIGLAAEARTLVLAAGANRVDVAMQPVVLGLDEIVVTGTAGAARRREVGAAAASLAPVYAEQARARRYGGPMNTESYARIDESDFVSARADGVSTFSIDVDRASYANVRRFIRDGVRPPVDAVRIEELVNYFTYADPVPGGDVPFTVTTEVAPAPWQPLHRLVRIALRAKPIGVDRLPPSNLVFLLDVSGSMSTPDKLPLVKRSLAMLVEELREQDRVSIVVYAGAAGLVLPPTPGSDKATILGALDRLEAGGSTAGGAGLRLAYDVAAEHHMAEGNNRVILATDGDFNVGASSDAEMVRLIEEKRAQGTYLTVLGFGTGNLKDSKMEQIADHGNGNFAYIDSELEARKALVSEMGGTLLTVAQDVKIQVEFNPARVAAYRLIGYENRLLADEDFADDTKDAGEIGAGHSVVALYEVIPVDVDSPALVRVPGPSRYQETAVSPEAEASTELLYVQLRYKRPGEAESRLLAVPVENVAKEPSADFRFAAAVAAWGMLLRESEHAGAFTLADVARLAEGALGEDSGGYRAEFLTLVDQVRTQELLAAAPGDSGVSRD